MGTVVGITGCLLSGKSVAGNFARELGYKVFDVLEEAEKICREDKELINLILKDFGDVYKRGLKGINVSVFLLQIRMDKDKGLKYFLEVMKRVRVKLIAFIDSLGENELGFIASTFIYESNFFIKCDYVITIVVDLEIAKQRFYAINGEADEYLYERVSSLEIPLPTKASLSGFVINNDSTVEILRSRVWNTIKLILPSEN